MFARQGARGPCDTCHTFSIACPSFSFRCSPIGACGSAIPPLTIPLDAGGASARDASRPERSDALTSVNAPLDNRLPPRPLPPAMQARPQLRARRSAVVPSPHVAPRRQHALAPRSISTKPSHTSHASTACFSARTAVSRFNCTTRHFSTGAPAEASKYPEVDLFRSFIKTEGLAAAEAKLQTLIVDGKIPDSNVFAVFLQEYARRGLAPQMASLSRAMGSAGVPLNRHGTSQELSLRCCKHFATHTEQNTQTFASSLRRCP